MSRDIQLAAGLHRISRLMFRVVRLDAALEKALEERDTARAALRAHCPMCGTLTEYGGDSYYVAPMHGVGGH